VLSGVASVPVDEVESAKQGADAATTKAVTETIRLSQTAALRLFFMCPLPAVKIANQRGSVMMELEGNNDFSQTRPGRPIIAGHTVGKPGSWGLDLSI
jgi:hypothetical protein